MTQRDRLEEAVALRRIGAFEDAARMLEKAREMGGGVNEQVAYQSGVLAEVRENWRGAISAYEAVAAGWPQSATAHDARFRRAYCLEELGEHRAATKAVKRLQREGRWSEDDERTMALQRGITELRSGKTVHPSLRWVVHEEVRAFTEMFPDIPLHVDMDPDSWTVRRGKQTILEK